MGGGGLLTALLGTVNMTNMHSREREWGGGGGILLCLLYVT